MIQAYRLDAGFSSRCVSCGNISQKAWAIKIRDGYEIELCPDCIKKLMRDISKELNNNPLEGAISSVEETLEVELALDMQEVVADFIKEAFLVEVTLPDGTLVRASRDDEKGEDFFSEHPYQCSRCTKFLSEKELTIDHVGFDQVHRCGLCGGIVREIGQ